MTFEERLDKFSGNPDHAWAMWTHGDKVNIHAVSLSQPRSQALWNKHVVPLITEAKLRGYEVVVQEGAEPQI